MICNMKFEGRWPLPDTAICLLFPISSYRSNYFYASASPRRKKNNTKDIGEKALMNLVNGEERNCSWTSSGISSHNLKQSFTALPCILKDDEQDR